MSWSTSELRVRLAPLNRFKPSSKIFYWPFQGGTSFVDLLCFCSVLCLLYLCASVYMCFVVTCWERADLLALVCGVFCEFVTFPLVSWVRCGTWLYRFLIFEPLLTFITSGPRRKSRRQYFSRRGPINILISKKRSISLFLYLADVHVQLYI